MTNPQRELREQVAAIIASVENAGSVSTRQVFTESWEEFADLFGWTDPENRRWVRGWMVMPSGPQARLRERSFGMGNVEMVVEVGIIIRAVQSLTERDSQYEAFNDVVWEAFLALARQRSYTVTVGNVTVPPTPSWDSYANRRIGGAACHTAELMVTFLVDLQLDLV